MIQAIILLILGLGLLIGGAEALVRGSASLARRWGITPLVIGLTVVAFGTSAPEMIVNLFSAIRGSGDIALGNILGSNTANILLILGIAAFLRPMMVKHSTTWKEIPFAFLAVVLLLVLGNDIFFDGFSRNYISRTDGLVLIAIFAIFIYYSLSTARVQGDPGEKITVYHKSNSLILVITGLIGLFIGGKLLVDNAVILATLAGISESLIGLTIIAVGTSLPELATSVIAVLRGHNDIAIGNVVGSNIFNVFWVLGGTAIIAPLSYNSVINIDVIVAIAATILLFIAIFVGKKHVLARGEGIAFILLYLIYIGYLIARG
ncbi:MAG: calcium/sodium antiporter [bacterium]